MRPERWIRPICLGVLLMAPISTPARGEPPPARPGEARPGEARRGEARPDDDRPPREARSATRPAASGRAGLAFQRLRDEVQSLDLSDDQKKQVEALFVSLGDELRQLRDARDTGRPIREQVQQIQQRAREGLVQILTPEQQRRLRDAMETPPMREGENPPVRDGDDRPRRERDNPPSREAPPGMGDGDKPPMRGGDDRPMREGDDPPMREGDKPPRREGSPGMGEGDPMNESGGREGRGEARERPPATAPAVRPLAIGAMAPDLTLTRLDGKPLTLASLRGKPTLLVFGSYSSPHFRQRAAAIETLRKRYAVKAHVVYVYTREAHPAGEWDVERNRDEKIAIPAHATQADRLAEAKRAYEALDLDATMVIDEMERSVADRFGGFPNGAVLLDRDGQLVARQRWVDPSGLEDDLEAALARPLTR